MKRNVLFCLLATLLAAQATAPIVEITVEPHHHLALQNKSVRVFNFELAPSSESEMHWHRHDYFGITLGDSELVNAVKDKPPVALRLKDGQTSFSSATFAHIARNPSSDHSFRNVTIEILEDDALRNSTAKWDEDRGLKVLTGGTEEILFVKDGIRATEFELQPGGVVPMHHYTGPHLFVAVSDLDLRSGGEGQGSTAGQMPAHLKSGDSKWFPGDYSRSITNTGAKPARFVTFEFPKAI